MPPFCEKHNTYHAQPGECLVMNIAAEGRARAKERDEKAARVADDTIREHVEQRFRPDATPTELMDGLAPGYGQALREIVIAAVAAGMRAAS